jgi:2-polyprenyl-3-methyl-5-hydroxy-6-metoxy-1,4-benzoquinol methylase
MKALFPRSAYRQDRIRQGGITLAASGREELMADRTEGHRAGNWSGTAGPYSRSFARLCAGTISPLLTAVGEAIGGLDGKDMLDVGCGTGTLAAQASRLGARVTAVDPDPEMLALTRRTAPRAIFSAGGVPNLPFEEGTFQAVTANFVVNHVEDPRAAVADLRRVCIPGGAVGVTVWPSTPSALNALWADVIKASGLLAPPPEHLPPGKDFERTRDGLTQLLTEAGLRQVRTQVLSWDFRIAAEDLWAGPAGGVAGIGKIVTGQTPSLQAEMKGHYGRLVSPLIHKGEVVLAAEALMAIGIREAFT